MEMKCSQMSLLLELLLLHLVHRLASPKGCIIKRMYLFLGRSDVRTLGRSDARMLGRSDARTPGCSDARIPERPDVRALGRSDAHPPHFQFLRPPRRGPEPGRAVTSRAAPALAAAAAKIAKKTNQKRKRFRRRRKVFVDKSIQRRLYSVTAFRTRWWLGRLSDSD